MTSKQPILKNLSEHDDIVGDVRQLLIEACLIDARTNINKSPKIALLTTKLVSYIVRRDHNTFHQAYKLAKEGHHGERHN